MKTLTIIAVMASTLLLAGCSDKLTVSNQDTTTSHNQMIDESKEHGHNDKGESVATDDSSNTDSMNHGGMMGMQHATITSEEQFIAEMIPHHQEAVDTAMIIVAKGENLELKTIAQAIIDGQSAEIAMMQGWFADWYPSSNYQVMYQNMMRPLESLDGHDLEDQFMEDMIVHHEGAIQMAQQVLEITQRPEIVAFANDIINAQSSEINKFQALLDDGTRH